MRQLVSYALLFVSTLALAQPKGPQKIRVFILPTVKMDVQERLRMPFESLVTQPKPKRESEMMKALGKWKGSEYSSGFRKEEVGDCTIYWHKDARNMEELAKILGILKKAQEGSSKQFGTVSGADLTESQKRTICWGLDKPVGSLNDEAHCCVQATANFVYSYKGEDKPLTFQSYLFSPELRKHMENPVKDAFIDQESIKARSNATSASGATQSGFEILVEPGFSGEAESNVFNIAVKYINDKYLSIETEYNRTEKALLDKFTESTFGKGRNRDNTKLKDIEDLTKSKENFGHTAEDLFHPNGVMSAGEQELMRSADFKGIELCMTFTLRTGEHNSSTVSIPLRNPFRP